MFKKLTLFSLLLTLFFLPNISLASNFISNDTEKEETSQNINQDNINQDNIDINKKTEERDKSQDIVFKAKVLEIIAEEEKEASGKKVIQQNLKLIGLESEFKDKEFIFYGISDLELIGAQKYSPGDKVLVVATRSSESDSFSYYITDYVRTNSLILISLIFIISLFLVGRFKGLRSILSLFLTFIVIIFFIIPQIMKGANPVLISSLGSLFILFLIIYLTEGINLKSHLASFSMFISLLLVLGISSLFIFLLRLNGAFNEDVFALINIGQQSLNLKGMLLAGMIIGSLGVLDDVIISQIASVEQLFQANPRQSWREVFSKAYKIGVSHISSMTNTLFLAYAGASLPLLILFVSPDNPFTSVEQILNNEAISTEIARALSGSLGLILSVPLSTFIASWFFAYKNKKKNI